MMDHIGITRNRCSRFNPWNSKGINLQNILNLWEEGYGLTEISKFLGCSCQNIGNRLKKLPLYDQDEVNKRQKRQISKYMQEERKRTNPVHNPEVRKKIRSRILHLFEVDPDYRLRISNGVKRNITREIRRKCSFGGKLLIKKRRENGTFDEWRMEGTKQSRRHPNKIELLFSSLLNKYFPNEWIYSGGGKDAIIIGGMIPDFFNVNGKKKIIELYGDYWHRGEDPQKRIDKYGEFGFDCLVLWEREINSKSEADLVAKIKGFIG